jgi:hypothetical protein
MARSARPPQGEQSVHGAPENGCLVDTHTANNR